MTFFQSYSKKTDEQLMQLIVKGNAHALTELYNRYSKKLVNYFYRMLWQNEALAQDFLQDLFLKIIERPEQFNSERNFKTWIYSVANNMCKNEYRRDAYRKAFQDQKAEMSIQPLNETQELGKVISETINKLSEEDRNLYVLRYESELSVEEIAALLDCPAGTVKSRSFALKKKIAKTMAWYYNEKVKYG